jgi:K+-transporting ATPase ATPase B chain
MSLTRDPEIAEPTTAPHERRAISLFQPDIVRRALIDSFIKLDPRVQIRNPVMFVVEIGAAITTVTWLIQVFGGKALGGHDPSWYTLVISVWLWLTVVFANMAEAFAEGRGRAQADTLRAMRAGDGGPSPRRVHKERRGAGPRRRRGRGGGRADPR